jgi:hypothetical protein
VPKKPANAAERRHLARLAALGCVVCRNEGYGYSPTSIHHIRPQGAKTDHYKAIPLCPQHHQHGGLGIALHAGQKRWEEKFGTEMELLAQVEELLDVKAPTPPVDE